jgi:hypothetical protein
VGGTWDGLEKEVSRSVVALQSLMRTRIDGQLKHIVQMGTMCRLVARSLDCTAISSADDMVSEREQRSSYSFSGLFK